MSVKRRAALGERLIGSMKKGLRALRTGERLRSRLVPNVPEPPPFDRARLLRLREHFQMGQTGFAVLLKVSPKTVQSWEQGIRHPSGATLRLLQLLESPRILQLVIGNGRRRNLPPRRGVGK